MAELLDPRTAFNSDWNCGIRYNLRRLYEDYKPLPKDWWSDDQKEKQCKKKTPDGAYQKKDTVRLLFNMKSLGMEYDIPKGDYTFDSYDTYDNTCFILVNFGQGEKCVNVFLHKIKKVILLRDLKPGK